LIDTNELDEGPGPKPDDPPPEVIALLASKARRRREFKRRSFNFADPGIALWLSNPED